MAVQKELSNEQEILKNSFQKIAKLKIIANFFNNTDLINIVIRTKIIHTIFESNKTLDIHKLELFHLQFTNSLIELVQKIKKSIEQQLHLISDEISINEQFIQQLNTSKATDTYKMDSNIYAKNMAQKTELLYDIFANQSDIPFDWTQIYAFAYANNNEFYRELNPEQYQSITATEDRKTYDNEHVRIEKKLLGKLNTQHFRIRFLCGLKHQSEQIDVFKFLNTNDKFIYLHLKNSFYLLEDSQTQELDLSKNKSSKQQLTQNLMDKNTQLEIKLHSIKSISQPQVLDVLKNYLAKISSVSFLEELENVDEQTNILKAMLNVKIQ